MEKKSKHPADIKFRFEIESLKEDGVKASLASVFGDNKHYIFKHANLNSKELITMSLYLIADVVFMKDKVTDRDLKLIYKYPLIIHDKKSNLLLLNNLQRMKGIIKNEKKQSSNSKH